MPWKNGLLFKEVEMIKKTAAYIFILNALIFFFQAVTKNIYPPLLLPLREAFLIDNAQAGFLVTLVFMGYALARFPSGVMADKWGCTKTILIGSLTMALSFLAVAFSPNFYSMAFFTFLLGGSSGIYVTAGYTLAVILGTRSRAATATAVFETFGMLAGIFSPLLVTVFILYLDWPLLFIILGVILLGITFVFYQKQDKSIRIEEKSFNISEKDGVAGVDPLIINAKSKVTMSILFQEMVKSFQIFREPHLKRFIVWSILVGGLGAISWTGVYAFIPTFLVEENRYSYDQANSLFALVAFAGLITKVGVGWLADRLGSRPVLFVNLLLSVLLIFALTLAVENWQFLIILMMLGATCLNTNTIINAYVMRKMPKQYQGTGFGIFSTAYTIIYSCGPFLTGLFSVSMGLSGAIRLSTAGTVAAMLLVLLHRHLLVSFSEFP